MLFPNKTEKQDVVANQNVDNLFSYKNHPSYDRHDLRPPTLTTYVWQRGSPADDEHGVSTIVDRRVM